MLDAKTNYLLSYLKNTINDDEYKLLDLDDIILSSPKCLNLNYNNLKEVFNFLDARDYINIRFQKDKEYLIRVLTKGRQYYEDEEELKKERKNTINKVLLFSLLGALIGSTIGSIITQILFITILK